MARELIAQTQLTLKGRTYKPGEVVSEVGLLYRQAARLIAAGALVARDTKPGILDSGSNSAERQADGKKDAESPRDKQARPARTK